MKLAAFVIALSAILVEAASNTAQSANALPVQAGYLACKPATAPARFQPLAFSSSAFIWTGEVSTPGGNNSLGVRGFRKVVASPPGKCATCAEMIVAADDAAQVFVNGKLVGRSDSWVAGSMIYTGLMPSSNVFAFLGNNTHDQSVAGVVAAIRIHYADGTSETIVTNDSWKTLRSVAPLDSFIYATFDDSTWTAAAVQSSPTGVNHPFVLPLDQSNWIWTSESQSSSEALGARAFRKTVSNCAKRAVCATAVIVADDNYTFWVNGKVVGSGNSFRTSEAWSIPALEPTYNVFAIKATNTGGPGGMGGTILITYSDGTTETITTDSTWLVSKDASEGFQETIIDDSGFTSATEVARFGAPNWPFPSIPYA
ncbi:hypothetical protein ONZ45_g12422 [Pleurotus djamor]|nr:hypothetical protein ONZ45_g12422 [Pleurotus djamor]